MQLLLIDDDELDRIAIKRSLQQEDPSIHIMEAATASEGLELMSRRDFDAVLLDHLLPDQTGLELLRALPDTLSSATAIIMLSGVEDMELAASCIQAGAQDYMLKSEVFARHLVAAITLARERHNLLLALEESRRKLSEVADETVWRAVASPDEFENSVRRSIAEASRHHESVALLLVGLDNLPAALDDPDPGARNRLMYGIVAKLLEVTRQETLLGRTEANQFVILASRLQNEAEARAIADRLLQSLEGVPLPDESGDTLQASIGVAMYPDCTNEGERLLGCAEDALRHARTEGGGGIVVCRKEPS